MTLNVRKAAERDIPKIMELLAQVEMIHHLGRPDIFRYAATKYNESELKDIINDENTPVFVCVGESDIPLGHAFCIRKEIKGDTLLMDMKTLYIDDICVDSAKRGKHVGKALYDHVISFAKSEGFYNVTLNVWSCNPSALRFYEAMGLAPYKIGMEKIL